MPVAEWIAGFVLLETAALDYPGWAVQVYGEGEIFAVFFGLDVTEIQQQVVLCCLQFEDLDVCDADFMGCDEVFNDEEQVSGLDRGYVLEVFDELESAHLQDLLDGLFLLPSDFLDDVGAIPVAVLQFYEFFPELSHAMITLSISR